MIMVLAISFVLTSLMGITADLVQDNAPYDVILANILPNPLIEMAPDAAVIANDGIIILSGLLDDQQDKVITAYQAQGAELVDRLVHNGWAALVMVKS